MTSQILPNFIKDSVDLIQAAGDDVTYYERTRSQPKEGREALIRIKNLLTVAQDLKAAAQRRDNQLRERARQRGIKDGEVDWGSEEEANMWKKFAVHIKRFHVLLTRMRKELGEYDTEEEPGVMKSMTMKFKMAFVHRDNLRKLNAEIEQEQKALMANLTAISININVDSQEQNEAKMRALQQQQEMDTKILLDALADVKNSMTLMSAAPSSSSLPDVDSLRPALAQRHTSSNRRFSSNTNNTIRQSSNESGSQDEQERTGRRILIERALSPRRSSRSSSPKVELKNLPESPFDESEPASPAADNEEEEEEEERDEVKVAEMPGREKSLSFASEYGPYRRGPSKRSLDHYNKNIIQCQETAAELRGKGSYTRAAEKLKRAMDYAAARQKWHNVPSPEIEMQNSLAEIYFDQGNYQEALEIWENLVRGKSPEDSQLAMEDIRNYYNITKTYFESWKGNKEPDHSHAAVMNGEICFTQRQELMSDTSHPTLSEIAELMATISERMSEPDEAAVYRTYIDQTEGTSNSKSKAESIRAPDMVKSASASAISQTNTLYEPDSQTELALGEDPTKALAKAISTNNVQRALRLLEVYADDINIEKRFLGGITLLMIAFETCRDKSVIETLLVRDANINTPDSEGRTILHRSAGDGDVEMVKLAIKLDAKIDARDNQDLTPLMYCTYMNPKHSDEVIKALLENETGKADVEASTYEQGTTALHYAAKNCARLGSSRSHKNSYFSPISRAGTSSPSGALSPVFDPDYKLRAMAMIRQLVSMYGADVDPIDAKGFTPLCIVCEAGYFPAVELLLSLDADANHVTPAKTTPLYLATNNQSATEDYIKTAWALVNANADTSEQANLPAKWKNEFKTLVEEERRRRQAPRSSKAGSSAGLVRQNTDLTINKIKGKGRKRATSEMSDNSVGGIAPRINSLASTSSGETSGSGKSSWSQKLGISRSR